MFSQELTRPLATSLVRSQSIIRLQTTRQVASTPRPVVRCRQVWQSKRQPVQPKWDCAVTLVADSVAQNTKELVGQTNRLNARSKAAVTGVLDQLHKLDASGERMVSGTRACFTIKPKRHL